MNSTKIEWADAVWNPITGCTPVSPGCANCYAKRMASRLAGRFGYPADDPFRVTFHPDRLDEPSRWKKPKRIFVGSMTDLFHPDVNPGNLDTIFWGMEESTQHTFLILTKRPERMADYFRLFIATENMPQNLWLGVTAENQEMADKRIPILLRIPAAVRFVSVEPMIGPVILNPYLYGEEENGIEIGRPVGTCVGWTPPVDWVIVGAETGPGARYMSPVWAAELADQCTRAGVPFFFKKDSGGRPHLPGGEIVREFPQ